jgi:hypothetical protein
MKHQPQMDKQQSEALLAVFAGMVADIVVSKLSDQLKPQGEPVSEEAFLTIQQVRTEVFNNSVSPGTLRNWTTKGLLKRHEIGGKVFYKRSEVLAASKTLEKYKQTTTL